MRLHEVVDQLNLPATHVADRAWDAAANRVRRRRVAALVGTATMVVLVAFSVFAMRPEKDVPQPSAKNPTRSAPTAEMTKNDLLVDGPTARPHLVVVDPANLDRRAVLWWSCDACDSPKGVLALTDDGFATRTLLPVDADIDLALAGDDYVAVVDWAAGTTEIVSFGDGGRRRVVLGPESPAPQKTGVVVASLKGLRKSVWIEVSSATAHPVPLPAEAAKTPDDSMWRDANGLVWFGSVDNDNVIATSQDGGDSWQSYHLGSGNMLPTHSGAKDSLAVFEYEDAKRSSLRLERVWYSTDGGSTWDRTSDGSLPQGEIDYRFGIVRADGNLVMVAPGGGELILMENWTYFAPTGWTAGEYCACKFLGVQGWGETFRSISRTDDGSHVVISSAPGRTGSRFKVR